MIDFLFSFQGRLIEWSISGIASLGYQNLFHKSLLVNFLVPNNARHFVSFANLTILNLLHVYYGSLNMIIFLVGYFVNLNHKTVFNLSFFRQLKCTRVTIHKHLFVSYILTAVFWITYYATTSFDPHVVADNPVSVLYIFV